MKYDSKLQIATPLIALLFFFAKFIVNPPEGFPPFMHYILWGCSVIVIIVLICVLAIRKPKDGNCN